MLAACLERGGACSSPPDICILLWPQRWGYHHLSRSNSSACGIHISAQLPRTARCESYMQTDGGGLFPNPPRPAAFPSLLCGLLSSAKSDLAGSDAKYKKEHTAYWLFSPCSDFISLTLVQSVLHHCWVHSQCFVFGITQITTATRPRWWPMQL